MKSIISRAPAALLAAFLITGCANENTREQAQHNADSHSHNGQTHSHADSSSGGGDHSEATHKSESGPNGGRLITEFETAIEFLVNEDRSVRITLLDEQRNAITPTDEIVSAIGGDRSNPTVMAFRKSGNAFISDKTIPEGLSVPLVLQFQASEAAAISREKFNVNLSSCPTCSYQEYACICGHGDH